MQRTNFLLLFLPLALIACGGRVNDERNPAAGGPPRRISEQVPEDEPPTASGDPACAGTRGSYPLSSSPQGTVNQLLLDTCHVYWVSSVGAKQGVILRSASKTGAATTDLANLPSQYVLLAQDAHTLYATVEWSTPSPAGPSVERGVVRVSKAGGQPETIVRARYARLQGILVAGDGLYFSDPVSLHRFDLVTGEERLVPTRGAGPILSLGDDIVLMHPGGLSRFDANLGGGEELFAPTEDLALEGASAAAGHAYVATNRGLYEVFGRTWTPVSDVGAPYFSVAARGSRVFFARSSSLEFGFYEEGKTYVLAKAGDLGNSTGLAADESGVYWVRNGTVERSEGEPSLP